MKINPEDSCAEAKRASKIDAVYSMVAKKKKEKHSKNLTKTQTEGYKIQTLK